MFPFGCQPRTKKWGKGGRIRTLFLIVGQPPPAVCSRRSDETTRQALTCHCQLQTGSTLSSVLQAPPAVGFAGRGRPADYGRRGRLPHYSAFKNGVRMCPGKGRSLPCGAPCRRSVVLACPPLSIARWFNRPLNPLTLLIWSLKFWGLEFIWDFGFGVWSFPPVPISHQKIRPPPLCPASANPAACPHPPPPSPAASALGARCSGNRIRGK